MILSTTKCSVVICTTKKQYKGFCAGFALFRYDLA